MSVLYAGFTLGLGLIISLGPQNVFLIRQGLKKERPYLVALVCCLCDVLLILLSTLSISKLILLYPTAKMIMITLAVLFLIGYGAKSIYAGVKQIRSGDSFTLNTVTSTRSLTTILLTTLSLSLLNPQAIIDTMIMIGSVVNQYPEADQVLFITGVIGASFLWFTGVATLASNCAKYLNSQKMWSALEIVSGFIMVAFSFTLFSV